MFLRRRSVAFMWVGIAVFCFGSGLRNQARAAHAGSARRYVRLWNAAYKDPQGFTAEAFGRYFTPDAVMRINGSDRSKGLSDLAQHFRAIQSHSEMVVIELPFIDEFTCSAGRPNFTHHFVRSRDHGKDILERVMGYATIRDGKISMINFLSVPADPAPTAYRTP